MKWAESILEQEFPDAKKLFKFLEERCGSLIISQDSSKTKAPSKSNVLRTFHVCQGRSMCPKCKLQHELTHCPQFTSLDISARRTLIKEGSLCFNCLRSGHKSSNCNSKFRCRQCSSKHRTLVHQSPVPEAISSTENQPSSSYASKVGRLSFHNQLSNELLLPNSTNLVPTALVLIPDVLGQLQACRILLDCGSQASFISESCVRRLRVNRKHARFPLIGVSGAKAGCTRGWISTQLISRFGHKSISINAYILSKVTEPLPSQSFSFSLGKDNYYMGDRFADPGFNIRSHVDIILGVDAVFQVIESIPVKSIIGFPDAVLTMFGWVEVMLSAPQRNLLLRT